MAGGKRASMREGPLAALFQRRTELTRTNAGEQPAEPAQPGVSRQRERAQQRARAPARAR